MENVLVTGAYGQVGTDLIVSLSTRYGDSNVVATDISKKPEHFPDIHAETLDVTDYDSILSIIRDLKISRIYHLASILSALGEKRPFQAFSVNVDGTFNVLKAAVEGGVRSVIIPSSIAVYGPGIDREGADSDTATFPNSIYGVSKVTAELLGSYFHNKFGLDVRGLRFPGLISYGAIPTAGTTDYAVQMLMDSVTKNRYVCYLRPDTMLPMMYMPDAIDSMLKLSEAPAERLTRRMRYNVSAFSFTPEQLASEIKHVIPEFEVEYAPDERQEIADSWPRTMDSSEATRDWGFSPRFDVSAMVRDMISNIKDIGSKQYGTH